MDYVYMIKCFALAKIIHSQAHQQDTCSRMDAKPYWFHMIGFSPRCIFKCASKLPAREFKFSPMCVIKYVFKVPALNNTLVHWQHLC